MLEKRVEAEAKFQTRAAPAAATAAEPQSAAKEAGRVPQSNSGAKAVAGDPVVKMEVDPPPAEEAKEKQADLKKGQERHDSSKASSSQQKKAESSMWV